MNPRYLSSALALALVCGCAALAQLSTATGAPKSPPPFTSVPPIEDRDLYYQAFQYVQGLINANNAAKAANPGQGAALDQQMASLLNVDVKELPSVVANTLWVTQKHADIAARQAAGPNKSSPMTAAQQNSQLAFERSHATASAVGALWKTLTPASWNGIHGYIVGPFKSQHYKKP